MNSKEKFVHMHNMNKPSNCMKHLAEAPACLGNLAAKSDSETKHKCTI